MRAICLNDFLDKIMTQSPFYTFRNLTWFPFPKRLNTGTQVSFCTSFLLYICESQLRVVFIRRNKKNGD